MTDYEIWFEYLAPQMNRNERLEYERKGLPYPGDDEDDEDETPFTPSRQYMMNILCGMLGMGKAEASAEYDRQAKMNAELQASKKKALEEGS